MPTPRLTPAQFETAVRVLPVFRARIADFDQLLAAKVGIDPREPAAEVVDAIASWQAAHPPTAVDGVLGPKTAAAMRGAAWASPEPEDYLLIDGARWKVPGLRVVHYGRKDGLSFYGRPGHVPRAGRKVNVLFNHWDAARSSHSAFATLLSRGLSAHVLLDADGTVYQALDLAERVAFHAGQGLNGTSVGMEICDPVYVTLDDPKRLRPRGAVEVASWGNVRDVVLGYHPEQVDAAVRINAAFCDAFGVPKLLPAALPGEPLTEDGVSRLVSPAVAERKFRGVAGHYHGRPDKADPGPFLWKPLRGAGFGVG